MLLFVPWLVQDLLALVWTPEHSDGQEVSDSFAVFQSGCDNSDYLSIFFNVVLPVAYEVSTKTFLI